MNALIDWTNFPPDVIEILLRDFNSSRKIFDGDIENVVPCALKSDDEKISRTRSIAEVFTPPHVVKFMVDAACVDSPIDSRRISSRLRDFCLTRDRRRKVSIAECSTTRTSKFWITRRTQPNTSATFKLKAV